MCPLLLSDFNEARIFSTDFLQSLKRQIYSKSVCGTRVIPCRRTDRHDKANSRFSQFWNAPNIVSHDCRYSKPSLP
jgi:hypothetical protein